MPRQRAAQEPSLFQLADCGTAVEGVVTHRLDGIEHGQPAPTEHLQVHTEACIHHFCQRHPFGKKRARARDQILHQAHVAIVEAPLDNVALGETLRRNRVERNVNPPLFQVP